MLTIFITFRKLYFLTNFRIFLRGYIMFFDKNGKNKKCSRFNANGLEFKLRAQRGMTVHFLTILCIMTAKSLNSLKK